jgi:hypothetical protein
MSALGHKRTFSKVCVMSALPPKADIAGAFMSTRPSYSSSQWSTAWCFRPAETRSDVMPSGFAGIDELEANWRYSKQRDHGRHIARHAVVMIGGFGAGQIGGFRAPLVDHVPSMQPHFNPSSPYTLPEPRETPVSPASPGSIFGKG